MKKFQCTGCGSAVFFKNDHCIKCGRRLVFLPDRLTVEALDEFSNGQRPQFAGTAPAQRYSKCQNENQHRICNWMIAEGDQNAFCLACRLNEVIPDLTVSGNCERWRKLELAKKRCLYTLLCLGLPIDGVPAENRPPLRFRFLASTPAAPVVTGYLAGMITVDIAEADDDERERRRLTLREPYRTLVGHFRHELGHFYWDRLIANSPLLPRFRELFGDESADYQAALQRHYEQGPAGDWGQRTITDYASAHPWEDWAETWAHYLHICDTIQTIDSFGLGTGVEAPAGRSNQGTFDDMFERWIPLSCALNSVNRSMGLPDIYPFVVPGAALEKLRFIHEVIGTRNRAAAPQTCSSASSPTTPLMASRR